MVSIDNKDLTNLIKLLQAIPILSNENGRKSVLIAANLSELLPQIDFSGPSTVAIPLMINFFATYGKVDYHQESLGCFLNTIKDYLSSEDRKQIDLIINKYDLIAPASNLYLSDPSLNISKDDFYEKIIGENTLRPIAFLQKGILASKSVCYIQVCDNEKRWSGTGFLISPNIVMTNNHVIPSASLIKNTIVRFNYQLDLNGNPEVFEDFIPKEKGIFFTNSHLDFSIIEIENNPGIKWGHLPITEKRITNDNRVNIIQHPNGLPKQITIQNNFVKYADSVKIQYITSTLPGSSGSPIFNDDWVVVGIHHAGGWIPEKDNSKIYFRNEGISINSILAKLPENIKKHLLIK